MPIALTITRDDYTAAELRAAATRSNDADATRRVLALALVLEGYKRCEAGKLRGMDRQTLRDWVLRYNAEGIAGLCNRMAAGPKPRLTPEQDAAGAELVRKGPDLAVDGVVRWRRVDLARVIKARFNVTLAERGVGAMLRRLGFRRLSVRPRHPRQDPAAQETHKKTSPIWSKPSSPSMRAKNRSNHGGRMKPVLVSRAVEIYWISGSPFAAAVEMSQSSWLVAAGSTRCGGEGYHYEGKLLEASKGELETPEFLAINPVGRVPALHDGDFTLHESLAIMVYLDRKHPSPPLIGHTAEEAGRIFQRISASISDFWPSSQRLIRSILFGPPLSADEARAEREKVHLGLARLEGYVESGVWMQRVEQLPGYDRTYPPHWREA